MYILCMIHVLLWSIYNMYIYNESFFVLLGKSLMCHMHKQLKLLVRILKLKHVKRRLLAVAIC